MPYFINSERFACDRSIWKASAPLKCKYFLWLAVRRRCWTADRLEHRGFLSHRVCIFCRSASEIIDHLLIGCAISAQNWARFLPRVGLSRCILVVHSSLEHYWLSARRLVSRSHPRGLDSCVTLISWMLWKERINRVFNNVASSASMLLQAISDEFHLWRMPGAAFSRVVALY